jgi:hypothetical protein
MDNIRDIRNIEGHGPRGMSLFNEAFQNETAIRTIKSNVAINRDKVCILYRLCPMNSKVFEGI